MEKKIKILPTYTDEISFKEDNHHSAMRLLAYNIQSGLLQLPPSQSCYIVFIQILDCYSKDSLKQRTSWLLWSSTTSLTI